MQNSPELGGMTGAMYNDTARRYFAELELMRVTNPTAYELVLSGLANYLESQVALMKAQEVTLRADGRMREADELRIRILDLEVVHDGDTPPPFMIGQ